MSSSKFFSEEAAQRSRETRKARVEARLAKGLSAVPSPDEVARDNPRSLKKAIAAYCWDCQGQDADPGVRWRIGNCTFSQCYLFPHRPHQRLMDTPPPKSMEH